MPKIRLLLCLCGLLTLLLSVGVGSAAPPAQVQELVSLTVQDAGYDRVFRPEQWTPILIRVRNNGDPITGSIVVRPDTSANGVANPFSTPVTLPNGADQQLFLYVVPRPFAQTLQVELLDESGQRIAARAVGVRPILPEDHLYVVVTEAVSGIIDVTGVASAGRISYQANWGVANLPDRLGALDAVDTLIITDADTNTLSSAQQATLTDWVVNGGHLIVAGGGEPGAIDTAAGLRDLLPFEPAGSVTVDNLSPLAVWAGKPNDALDEPTVITTGTVRDGARVLSAREDGTPLLIRHTFGGGTVDYLTANPQTGALRNWAGQTDLWFMLMNTVDPIPSWGHGFLEWRQSEAVDASQILPGTNVLPDVLSLCGFLGLYIALVGPVNYFLLSRINRREWAWITIPLLIILFSVLAWVVGFNLRGNEATIGRITLVRSWSDAEFARVEQVLGLLSPRRSSYSMIVTADGAGGASAPMLRPVIGNPFNTTPLATSAGRAQATIQQTDRFRAADFAVDASLIATFKANTTIPRPAISGQVTLLLGETDSQQQLRGSVRNDTDFTLTDPVILARNTAYALGDPLEPGEIATFDTPIFPQSVPAPSALEHATASSGSPQGSYYSGSYFTIYTPDETIRHLMGTELYERSYQGAVMFEEDTPLEQDARRRRLFLNAFIVDNYYSTARANNVYLAGWAETAPLGLELEGAAYRLNDLTLYIIELETTVDTLTPAATLITADQFVWVAEERGFSSTVSSPFDIALFQEDELIFRFTPIGSAQLSQVDELIISVDQGQSVRSFIDLEIWDWEAQTWEAFTIQRSEAVLTDPAYIGPHNSVRIRIAQEVAGGLLQLSSLQVMQRGRF